MNSNRKIAIPVGIFMIAATVTFMIGSELIDSDPSNPEFLK